MKKRSIFWFEISLYYPDSEGSLVNYSFLFPFINNFDCDSWLFFDIFSFGALLIKFNYYSITYIKLRYTNCLETDAKVSVKAILVHLLQLFFLKVEAFFLKKTLIENELLIEKMCNKRLQHAATNCKSAFSKQTEFYLNILCD